jgi:hypothetical protein
VACTLAGPEIESYVYGMNNNTLNVKPVKTPQTFNNAKPAASKPAADCGCDTHAGKHQIHGQKGGKR